MLKLLQDLLWQHLQRLLLVDRLQGEYDVVCFLEGLQ